MVADRFAMNHAPFEREALRVRGSSTALRLTRFPPLRLRRSRDILSFILDCPAPEDLFCGKAYSSMARKKNAQRRDWRMTVFLAISVVIILSMVLGSVLLAALPN